MLHCHNVYCNNTIFKQSKLNVGILNIHGVYRITTTTEIEEWHGTERHDKQDLIKDQVSTGWAWRYDEIAIAL